METILEDLADEDGVVTSVQIRVGALSGVVPDACGSLRDVACETHACDSRLEIDEIDVRILV